MRILIHEHICGGGMQGDPLPAELAKAGGGMLRAAVEDFVNAGCHVTTTLDPRVELALPGANVAHVETGRVIPTIDSLAKDCGAALIIAPESAGILHAWAERLVAWNVHSLGSSPDAVRLCSDKLATFEHLSKHAIQTPTTIDACARDDFTRTTALNSNASERVVVKPRDGAGCENTFALAVGSDLRPFIRDKPNQSMVLQQGIEGRPASVSFIVTRTATYPLLVGDQHIAGSSQLHYEGGALPSTLNTTEQDEVIAIARRAIDSIQGLNGYVGVDLIVETSTGHPWVIDINPRLTVSYCALRALASVNLAEVMLEKATPGAWPSDCVTFDASGGVLEASR